MQLIINTNSATNPQLLDLSNEIDVQRGDGMDPASPQFSDRVFTHSLLKEGATFTLENAQLKEIIFPLLVGANLGLTSSGVATRIQLINQILQTPGATASWQDDGMSQPTYFTLASGQIDVDYDFRSQGTAHFTRCKMRLFAQPFATPAAPRLFAAASGIGPLLMISPYASSGALSIAASTQAGVAGFGGKPAGASTGIFYGGNPSLAGDAPALLQISYAGPAPTGATLAGVIPNIALSWLPDQNYAPLITASQIMQVGGTFRATTTAVAGTYINNAGALSFYPNDPGVPVPATWAGQHRLFAIARASTTSAGIPSGSPVINMVQGPGVQMVANATVTSWDWSLYDLGTFTLRASEPAPVIALQAATRTAVTPNPTCDITALVMLPDNATWFLNPQFIQGQQYGWPSAVTPLLSQGFLQAGFYSNTFYIDDTLPDQFVYAPLGASSYTPSVAGMVASSARVTQFSRGLIPRPDPSKGLPILAILGVAQQSTPTSFYEGAAAGNLTNIPAIYGSMYWQNPQNVRQLAQVSIVERARYVLS